MGVVFTVLIEFANAAYSIYQAKQKWNKGKLIQSREKFIENTISALVLALSRSGYSIGGMFLGQCVIPIPFLGSVIGLLVGTLVGHLAGEGISEICSSHLAAAIDKRMSEYQSLKTKQD